jgi:catechol 2,3-dioxygenase-like lactoylglutathione lyase family enzyme
MVHAISARGWGPSNHADFLHFFFGSGQGSTIAFFYYIGAEQPDFAKAHDDYRYEATHTAWQVHSYEELLAWRERLEAQGIPIMFQIRHELIESIYFRDPNGYYLEITLEVRDMTPLDADDATLTMEAAMSLEDAQLNGKGTFESIDQVWHEKARRLSDRAHAEPSKSAKATMFVLDVPEFETYVKACQAMPSCKVTGPVEGYWHIESGEPIVFERKPLGLTPALWNAALTGGYQGKVTTFDRYRLEIAPEVQP